MKKPRYDTPEQKNDDLVTLILEQAWQHVQRMKPEPKNILLDIPDPDLASLEKTARYREYLQENYGTPFLDLVIAEINLILVDAIARQQTLGNYQIAQCKAAVSKLEYEAKQKFTVPRLQHIWILAIVAMLGVAIGILIGSAI